MLASHRYREARAKAPGRTSELLLEAVAAARQAPDTVVHIRHRDGLRIDGRQLHASMTVHSWGQLRVVVSCHSMRGRKLPRWEDLVVIRSVVWPDEAEVHQVFPPGDQPYGSLTECLHLWGPIPMGGE